MPFDLTRSASTGGAISAPSPRRRTLALPLNRKPPAAATRVRTASGRQPVQAGGIRSVPSFSPVHTCTAGKAVQVHVRRRGSARARWLRHTIRDASARREQDSTYADAADQPCGGHRSFSLPVMLWRLEPSLLGERLHGTGGDRCHRILLGNGGRTGRGVDVRKRRRIVQRHDDVERRCQGDQNRRQRYPWHG
jgi:hypothetical protein